MEPKPIKEQIGLLIQLQVVDGEIYELNREKNDMPGKIKLIEENLEHKNSGIKQAEENLKNLQLKLKEKEINLQQKEEQINKFQTQLYQLKTNKEYTAMLTEIGGLKADNSLIEEDVIRLMDEIDLVKKKISEEKELFKIEGQKAQKEKDVIDTRGKEIEAMLSGLNANRETIAQHIDKQVLARYERVLKNKEGLAMAAVENGSCGGCHMNLPPQVISEVKIREEIIICGNCLRILYMEDNAEVN